MTTGRVSRKKPPPPPLHQRLLLRAGEAAALLSVSRELVLEWQRLEMMPAPIRIGAVVGWRADELRAWVEAGCPPRDEWKWRPTVWVNLERYIRELEAEAVERGRELATLRGLLERGEKFVEGVMRR